MATIDWRGLYDLTRESKQSLEEDIWQLATTGKVRGETNNGGTFEKIFNSDGSSEINLYESSSSKKGYSHVRVRIDARGNAQAELVHK